jgi:hypothetical protein
MGETLKSAEKWQRGMTQVVKHLFSKCKVLSSKTSTIK